MKLRKVIKKYPFLLMILVSTVIFTIIGIVKGKNLYNDYEIEVLNTPQFAVIFQGIKEGKYPWMREDYQEVIVNEDIWVNVDKEENSYVNVIENDEKDNHVIVNNVVDNKDNDYKKDSDIKLSNKDKKDSKPTKDDLTTVNKIDSKEKSEIADDDVHEIADNNIESNKLEDSNKADDGPNPNLSEGKASPEVSDTKNIPFTTVTKDYFNDALFIGDSRTVGLSEYSELTNSTYYADVGLTIYDIFDKKIVNLSDEKVTILEALGENKFKKIYIMLGINELGRGTTKTFVAEYQKVIAKIQELQPEALIFVEGIMKVSKEKSDKDPIFNNTNIKEKNDSIASLADYKSIFYINVNEAITDESGNLPSKYTHDYVHLKAAYYDIWTEFLLKHGVDVIINKE